MLARMSDSLTAAGPMLVTPMREILRTRPPIGAWAQAAPDPPCNASQSRHANASHLFRLRIRRNIFTADFGCALKPRVRSQKCQTDISRRPVSLLGNKKIHWQCVLRSAVFIGFVFVLP